MPGFPAEPANVVTTPPAVTFRIVAFTVSATYAVPVASTAIPCGPGERYILGGENLTLKQILDKLAAITGLPSPKLKLPYAVAYATGVVDTLVSGTIMGREPRVTLDSVRMGRDRK